jgi:hypothetical protein
VYGYVNECGYGGIANIHVLQIGIGIAIGIGIGFEIGFAIDCCAHAVARSDKCNDGGDPDPDGDGDGAAMEP